MGGRVLISGIGALATMAGLAAASGMDDGYSISAKREAAERRRLKAEHDRWLAEHQPEPESRQVRRARERKARKAP